MGTPASIAVIAARCTCTASSASLGGGTRLNRPIKVAILSFLFNWPSTGGGNIHTVSEYVVLLSDHVAEIAAAAEPDPPLLGRFRIAVGHSALDFDGTTYGVDDAGKFHQNSIAGVLD